MSKLIDGRAMAATIRKELTKRVEQLTKKGITPHMAVILVGDDKPSALYVKRKGQAAKKIGIEFSLFLLPTSATVTEIKNAIKEAHQLKHISGIIVQLPLPDREATSEIIDTIDPNLDVDALTTINKNKLVAGDAVMLPPTPAAILHILKELHVNLSTKKIAIIGTGMLVGKPLESILAQKDALVTMCNKKTANIPEICNEADIIITATGQAHLITPNMVKKDAIVIDAGISFENGKMLGDADVEDLLPKVKAITPTPGGVGPITVAKLFSNVVDAAERKYS